MARRMLKKKRTRPLRQLRLRGRRLRGQLMAGEEAHRRDQMVAG
jgi:hypothetical protein